MCVLRLGTLIAVGAKGSQEWGPPISHTQRAGEPVGAFQRFLSKRRTPKAWCPFWFPAGHVARCKTQRKVRYVSHVQCQVAISLVEEPFVRLLRKNTLVLSNSSSSAHGRANSRSPLTDMTPYAPGAWLQIREQPRMNLMGTPEKETLPYRAAGSTWIRVNIGFVKNLWRQTGGLKWRRTELNWCNSLKRDSGSFESGPQFSNQGRTGRFGCFIPRRIELISMVSRRYFLSGLNIQGAFLQESPTERFSEPFEQTREGSIRAFPGSPFRFLRSHSGAVLQTLFSNNFSQGSTF